MALRNILKDGDSGLLKKSRIVTDFNKRLHILLDDMRETLIDAYGLGLAAPQVGVLRRAVLIVDTHDEPNAEPGLAADTTPDSDYEEQLPDSKETGSGDGFRGQIIELINPELVYEEGEQTSSEGCLSLPGRYGLVTRPKTVKVKAQDRYGVPFELDVSDMAARAVCHEIDHLNGIIFTSVAERMLTEEEVEQMRRQNDEDTDDGANEGE